MNTALGRVLYKQYIVQQHSNVFNVFTEFLKEIAPARILEIGTAGGGFTLFLRETLNDIGLHTSVIKSFEVIDMPYYKDLRMQNIEINIENIFDHLYMKLEKPELIVPFIQSDGTTLVLCDGGHKVGEFNEIAPHLKSGDFIMAHDYIDTLENFKEHYENKIWNWREIGDERIQPACDKYNLISYRKHLFDPVVWVCKKRI
jgi:cephalosporin hydroxylase